MTEERRSIDPLIIEHMTETKTMLKSIDSTMTDLRVAIDGKDGKPGVRMLVDRHDQWIKGEETKKTQRNAERAALWVTALGGVGTWIAHWLGMFGKLGGK
jgi:hypothetical protein